MNYLKCLLLCFSIIGTNVYASDLAKEKRWADQVIDAILDGEAVWLNDNTNKFLGIYTETEEASNLTAIIMHGTGVHPDWQQVVQPLRVGLTENGWNTLSIQMPVLANEAEHHEYAPLYKEVTPRIDAAIEYLKSTGAKKIVLIGHSQGASMAAYYLTKPNDRVNGLVAIGLSGYGKDLRMNGEKSIEKIKVPMLDLYGDEDLESVLASTNLRQSAANKSGNSQYTQKKITGNHFFDDNNDELIEAVSSWLNALK